MEQRLPQRLLPSTLALHIIWLVGILVLCYFDFKQFGQLNTIPLFGDQVHYDGMAVQLLQTHIYSYWQKPYPQAMAMPGYPIFVAIVYKIFGYGMHRLNWLWNVQFVVFLCDVGLLYLLGKQLRSSRFACVLSFLLAALPFVFLEPFRVLTENLAVPAFLIYLNAYLWLYRDRTSTGRWVCLGLTLGLMALVRPGLAATGLIPLILFFRSEGWQHRWKTLLLFLVCCALPLVPWWIRNIISMHQFILFDQGEAANTIWAGTYPGYMAGPPNFDFTGVDQMALAKHRIASGFAHEPLKYFMWYTVWRFHYNFDSIYLPLMTKAVQHLSKWFVLYQRAIVWGSILFTVCALLSRKWRQLGVLTHFFYMNLILLVMLIPFHPEPRFAIYNVMLFAIVLIAGVFKLVR